MVRINEGMLLNYESLALKYKAVNGSAIIQMETLDFTSLQFVTKRIL